MIDWIEIQGESLETGKRYLFMLKSGVQVTGCVQIKGVLLDIFDTFIDADYIDPITHFAHLSDPVPVYKNQSATFLLGIAMNEIRHEDFRAAVEIEKQRLKSLKWWQKILNKVFPYQIKITKRSTHDGRC